jgi:serine/threonine-protein kinase
MGEVYRARDTRLGRQVALKILPEAFSQSHERMARFSREAQILASLNHPKIAAIHGLEESDGIRALVMELVEGPTLADRIAQGPPAPEEALEVAAQIAEALEYAHEKGFVHRDLKPANIKITPEGMVKLLDFGLAKAADETSAPVDTSVSPTLTIRATQAGVILGTAAYMAPEQARGKSVDKRADIWAFGCVLFELLTGRQAFHGETVSDILAAVLRAEPDWTAVPANTPERARYLLRRCLTKEPATRLRDIGEARVVIAEASTAGAPEAATVITGPPRRRLSWIPWTAAALMTFGAALAFWAYWQARQVAHPVIRVPVSLPPGDRLVTVSTQPALAFSADGTRLVYQAYRSGRGVQLFLRRMDHLDSNPIPGTEGASGPFFSPDGEWIGFFAEGKLKKMRISGGAAVTVADAPSPRGATWGEDDSIVYAPSGNSAGLLRVPATGGVPQTLTTPDRGQREIAHRWPQFLPGAKALVYTGFMGGGPDASRVWLLRLDPGERRILADSANYGRYVPTGHLLFTRSGSLLAAPFDARNFQVTGKQVPILDGVMTNTASAAFFTFSNSGVMVYVPGGSLIAPRAVVWVDRKGAAREVARFPSTAYWARVSPEGQRIAITAVDAANADVWISEPGRGRLTRLTFDAGLDAFPIWTPDGKRVIFSSSQSGATNLFWKAADGTGTDERLTTSTNSQYASSVSSDNRWLAFYELSTTTSADIWVMPLEGDRKPKPFLQTPAWEGEAMFSPDSRWLAYVSSETGSAEVYVQPFPEGVSKGKWLVSSGGGREPVWSRNGRELFYRNGNQVMKVDVGVGTSFLAGKAKALFEGQYFFAPGFLNLDISPDGQRFLMIRDASPESAAVQFNLVVNWFAELKRLAK